MNFQQTDNFFSSEVGYASTYKKQINEVELNSDTLTNFYSDYLLFL